MERYLCIHGHFYQPPRENPWLEAVELQDSAHPYHDWNERITAECYAPNSASRIMDGDGRVLDIVSNYSRMSFNFGPTLLSWMEANSPDVYSAILEADRVSAAWRSGHGNALAQPYNHMIMPLATARDKRTQVIWGIADFSHRFGRRPEGMWLPETAVDIETLRTLSEQDIRFTVLAPGQASRERKAGTRRWRDVSNSRIDPARPYLCRLPGGRSICVFFYDGPISQAVAFEHLLARGEDFAERIISGFSDSRTWPQILSIATDGETYGHHQRFGDMALAYALNDIESKGLARLTNFAEYLEKYPPEHEVELFENSSWSCIHGIERWRDNCGCNSGGRSDWNQRWRKPLRETLDWLRDQLQFRYENSMRGYLKDPWVARDSYIDIVLDRSPEKVQAFTRLHGLRSLDADETANVLGLLEMQRHAMLMYTSCGWFFDEISSIETTQILKYAARAIQLCEESFGGGLEKAFEERLAAAESNISEKGNGAAIFESSIRPAVIDIARVGVHFAISSLFEDYPEESRIFCYEAHREAHELRETGDIRLLLGRVRVSSVITLTGETLSYAVIHFGQHALNCGIRIFQGDAAHAEMQEEMLSTFEKGNLADIVRLMDRHFGNNNFTLRNLFLDGQRKILTLITSKAVSEMVEAYREIFANNGVLMEYLSDSGMPVPDPYRAAAAAALNHQLLEEFSADSINAMKVQSVIAGIRKWGVAIQAADTEFRVRKKIEKVMEDLAQHPDFPGRLVEMQRISELAGLLPFAIDFWHVQNLYFSLARSVYPAKLARLQGDPDAQAWVNTFRHLGELLRFNVGALLPADGSGGEAAAP